ncbi:hypothetical protein [Dyadobacter crusticola]|uniref:hypothetical protein n=1 Tax=Dyadobacter crusticola TaxID=292407 RepID=UPI000AC17770|nr:hypothetical protein [Dyadobacter crusticola]
MLAAAMLLVVAGAWCWSDYAGLGQNFAGKNKEIAQKNAQEQASSQIKAKVSTLSMEAVIAPAVSFDFSHYIYFLPQLAWHFVARKLAVRFAFQESFFLVSYFQKIFGKFVVTNAP